MNLSLSFCAAPLAELSDCMRTLHSGCWPQPHGCARFLETPGCDGTMVVARPLTSADAGADSDADADAGNEPDSDSDTQSCSLRVR